MVIFVLTYVPSYDVADSVFIHILYEYKILCLAFEYFQYISIEKSNKNFDIILLTSVLNKSCSVTRKKLKLICC